MPLSKKRDKARKRIERALGAIQPNSNLNPVQLVQPKQEKIVKLQGVIDALQSKSSLLKEEARGKLPMYNSQIHKPGDRVLVKPSYSKRLIETVIPEIDGEGNPIYEE